MSPCVGAAEGPSAPLRHLAAGPQGFVVWKMTRGARQPAHMFK